VEFGMTEDEVRQFVGTVSLRGQYVSIESSTSGAIQTMLIGASSKYSSTASASCGPPRRPSALVHA
jgi:hypothetical protein